MFESTEPAMGEGCDWELIIDIIEFLVELALAVCIFLYVSNFFFFADTLKTHLTTEEAILM